jgi:hypothetical protein
MVRWLDVPVKLLDCSNVLSFQLTSVVFVDDVIARNATEDEEAVAESHAARLTCPALTMVRLDTCALREVSPDVSVFTHHTPILHIANFHPDSG